MGRQNMNHQEIATRMLRDVVSPIFQKHDTKKASRIVEEIGRIARELSKTPNDIKVEVCDAVKEMLTFPDNP